MPKSLRQAAGHNYRNNVMITQDTDTTNELDEGLIRLTLWRNGQQLILWLTPTDLYERGFTNNNGVTFQFNDTDYKLVNALNQIPNSGIGVGHLTMSFGSNYNSMTQAAGRGRGEMPISWNDLTGSFDNLANTTNPYGANQQNVARSLMFRSNRIQSKPESWPSYRPSSNGTKNSSAWHSRSALALRAKRRIPIN